jgi:hypothetical protein
LVLQNPSLDAAATGQPHEFVVGALVDIQADKPAHLLSSAGRFRLNFGLDAARICGGVKDCGGMVTRMEQLTLALWHSFGNVDENSN